MQMHVVDKGKEVSECYFKIGFKKMFLSRQNDFR